MGVWIEKGMGLVIPGFIPTPTGEILEYAPNATEVGVSIGVWGIGLLLFTLLAKAGIPIECGALRRAKRPPVATRTRGGATVPAASPASPESP